MQNHGYNIFFTSYKVNNCWIKKSTYCLFLFFLLIEVKEYNCLIYGTDNKKEMFNGWIPLNYFFYNSGYKF